MRRTLYRLIQIFALLLLLTLIWGCWYVSNRGFTRKWRNQLIEEFHKRGIEVSFRRLTLDPLRGLVARDVKIGSSHAPEHALAVINSIVLDINYANLIQGEPFLNGIDLRDARLALPLEEGEPLVIERLNAKLRMPPHQLQVTHATADCYGTRISAKGLLVNTDLLHTGGSENNGQHPLATPDWLPPLLKRLQTLKTKGDAPQLAVTFSGDFSDLQTLFAEATLSGHDLECAGVSIRSLWGQATLRQRQLEIKQLNLSDSRGRLNLSGHYFLDKQWAQLRLHSTLDPLSLKALWPWLNECVFYSVPEIDLSGEGHLKGNDFQLVGHLGMQKFSIRSVVFEGLSTGFAWKGDDWYLADLQLWQRSGQLKADALCRAGNWQANLQSNLNPRTLLPFISGKAAEVLGDYEFEDSPQLKASIQGQGLELDQLSGSGELTLGATRIRGLPLKTLSSQLAFRDKQLFFEGFKATRAEGTATGTVVYDFGRHEVRLEKIESGLMPLDVLTCIDLRLAQNVAPYRFKNPPRVLVNGKVQFAPPKETALEVRVDSPTGMDYVFLKKNLPATTASARLFFTEGRLRISNLKADLFKGRLEGEADISLRKEAQNYTATLRANRIDFESVTNLYFQYSKSGGVLNGEFKFSGLGANARMLQGKGALEVIDGNVFSIPLFGSLSDLFNIVLPGAGYQEAHKGSASFDVKEGVIHTEDFIVKGLGFAMIGKGDLYFLDDKIDFDIRLNARGAPGVVLFPVSKLFEYTGEGSLKKPTWGAKRF